MSAFACLIVLLVGVAVAAAAATWTRRALDAHRALPFARAALGTGIAPLVLLWAESELRSLRGIPSGLLLILILLALGSALIGIKGILRARPPRAVSSDPAEPRSPTSAPARSARLPPEGMSLLREEVKVPLKRAGALALLIFLLVPIFYSREGSSGLKGLDTLLVSFTLLGIGDVIIIGWASVRTWRRTDRRNADPALRAPLTFLVMTASCIGIAVAFLVLMWSLAAIT